MVFAALSWFSATWDPLAPGLTDRHILVALPAPARWVIARVALQVVLHCRRLVVQLAVRVRCVWPRLGGTLDQLAAQSMS